MKEDDREESVSVAERYRLLLRGAGKEVVAGWFCWATPGQRRRREAREERRPDLEVKVLF